jgi:hypothetical protein
MLWLESVIGTACWCWWQAPARRFNGASGRSRCDKTRLASTALMLIIAFSTPLRGGWRGIHDPMFEVHDDDPQLLAIVRRARARTGSSAPSCVAASK